MSGFVALVRADGAAVDEPLLERLTGVLAARGPDAQRWVALESVGLGHALLATHADARREAQPRALGDVWISGDVRLDARTQLRAELQPLTRCDLSAATDVELVLHAYGVWSERCVEHFLGDFAFVVWDAARGRLFAARDPLGVKLLYHARPARTLVLSNTLACVRAHPDVSDRLDDRAVGAFLLWGEHDDRAATMFADVRALPAGHTLTWSAGSHESRIERYWEPPDEPPPLRYADRRDAIDHFRALLDAAVEDRLRGASVAVFMSGGMDSPMVAAVARDRLAGVGSITTLTLTFEPLLPDRERHFSTLAAQHLRIPIRHFAADHLFRSWDWMRATHAPEPQMGLANAPSDAAYRAAHRDVRVALTGYDGDTLLAHALAPLWRARLRKGEIVSLGRELGWHARRGRLPRIGVRAGRARRVEQRSDPRGDAGFPGWIRPEFERAQDLRVRWRAGQDQARDESCRAPVYRALASTVWRNLFDAMDPSMTGTPLEHRHPLADVRLIEFALSLPPVPWCVDKHLFRTAMRGVLPEAVVRRPKQPLCGDLVTAGLAAMPGPPMSGALAPELSEYVDPARYRDACAALYVARPAARPLAFAAYNTAGLEGWLGSPVRRSNAAT